MHHMTIFHPVENFEIYMAGHSDDVIVHFRKKSLFFRDTRYHQEYDAKIRLSLPGPSSSKVLAEV